MPDSGLAHRQQPDPKATIGRRWTTTISNICAAALSLPPRHSMPVTSPSAHCSPGPTGRTGRGSQSRWRRRPDASSRIRTRAMVRAESVAHRPRTVDGVYLRRALPDVLGGACMGRPGTHRVCQLLGPAHAVAHRARRATQPRGLAVHQRGGSRCPDRRSRTRSRGRCARPACPIPRGCMIGTQVT